MLGDNQASRCQILKYFDNKFNNANVTFRDNGAVTSRDGLRYEGFLSISFGLGCCEDYITGSIRLQFTSIYFWLGCVDDWTFKTAGVHNHLEACDDSI